MRPVMVKPPPMLICGKVTDPHLYQYTASPFLLCEPMKCPSFVQQLGCSPLMNDQAAHPLPIAHRGD